MGHPTSCTLHSAVARSRCGRDGSEGHAEEVRVQNSKIRVQYGKVMGQGARLNSMEPGNSMVEQQSYLQLWTRVEKSSHSCRIGAAPFGIQENA